MNDLEKRKQKKMSIERKHAALSGTEDSRLSSCTYDAFTVEAIPSQPPTGLESDVADAAATTTGETHPSAASNAARRVTRSRMSQGVQSFVKQEDVADGNVLCPLSSQVTAVADKGCNTATCRNHQPQFALVFFCVHCKKANENCVEHSACDCPKRNNREARALAQQERNTVAAENPVEICKKEHDNDPEHATSECPKRNNRVTRAQAQMDRNAAAAKNPIEIDVSSSSETKTKVSLPQLLTTKQGRQEEETHVLHKLKCLSIKKDMATWMLELEMVNWLKPHKDVVHATKPTVM